MPKQTLPDKKLPWPIAWAAVVLIAQKEGLRLSSYLCPAKVWTIGWGETSGVVPGMRWTKEQADQRFCDSLTAFTARVLELCKRTPNENQLGALVSLAYNIGLGGIAKSTVLRAFNAGNDAAAARAFGFWNKAKVDGVLTVLAGLTARRAAESALFLTPVDADAPHEPMPQAVASESTLATSPIAQSGAVTAGAGVLTLLSSAKEQADNASAVSDIATTASNAVHTVSGLLGIPTPYLLGAVLLAAGVAIVAHRYKQRAEGWA